MDYFIGIDISLNDSSLCVMDQHGNITKEAKILSEPEALISFVKGLPHEVTGVGLEAGPLSQWLHKHLAEAGINVVLMETRQVKGALKAMPIKTDRRDAQGIAHLLRMGWFRPVHCKSISAQEVRALLSGRRAVQAAMMDLENAMRGVLRNFGLKVGKVSKGQFEARVRELAAGNAMLEAAVDVLVRSRAALRAEFATLDKKIRDIGRNDAVCRLMMTVPGVGVLVALTVKAAIDDPARFSSSKMVGPHFGLTPGRNQSGEQDVVGRITKAGDASVRAMLFEAATALLCRTQRRSWLQAWGMRVAARRGLKRAVIAVSRRLAVILHRMWVDGTEFRYSLSPAA